MSLSGAVEDLPLLEILQVVSFCQKTGHLTVESPSGEAGVVFESGRVVSGYIWDTPPLPSDQPPPGPARELVVRQRIASILERLVRLRTGTFAFHLADAVPGRLGTRDLTAEMLPFGINPEELMLDLARQLDEDRRDAAAAIQASFATPPADAAAGGQPENEAPLDEEPEDESLLEELDLPPAPEPEPAPAPPAPSERPAVLLVDDEADVCRIVGERLAASGFDVAVAGSTGAARREMERLSGGRGPLLVVTDLGLPSGSSFRGGLDVARYASGLTRPSAVLLMAETIDEKLRARARRLGVSQLAYKPGLSKLDPRQYAADLRAFADKLAADLLPRLLGRESPARRESGPVPGDAARDTLLRSVIEEMRSGADPDMIAFLLLRAARAFLPRVLLFLVADDRLRGLSGFGPVDGPVSLDLLARDLAVPLDAPSPFAEAVASGKAWLGAVPDGGVLGALLDRIGPLGARAATILPVRAHRETIAVLYGDAPGGDAVPPIEPLASFVEEAGQALDAALLARRAPAPVAC